MLHYSKIFTLRIRCEFSFKAHFLLANSDIMSLKIGSLQNVFSGDRIAGADRHFFLIVNL